MTNFEWHRCNLQPIHPRPQFLGWYLRHEASCACRPIPEHVLSELDALGIVTPGRVHRLVALPSSAGTAGKKTLERA